MCFLYSYVTIPLRRLSTSVQSGLPVVLLEPFELRDHDVAGWEALLVFARTGARQEYLDKSRFRGRRLSRIPGGDNDQAVNYFARVLDALSWDAAAIRVAQQVGSGLRQ